MGLLDSMGNFLQGDFVKQGVKEMMIARPENNQDLIYKHPDRTIPMFAQVTVRADEWVVFSKDGRPVATLPAGRHTLSTQNIPFLSNFIDQYTGGNFLITELYFVRSTPMPKKFGGTLGNMIDPMTSIRIRPRCHGELMLKVVNPEAMIYQYFGMGKFQENPEVFDWYINAFFNALKNTIGKIAHEQHRTVLDLLDMQMDLARMTLAQSQDLAATGLQVVGISQLDINLSEEDEKRFDEMNQKLAEQKVGIQMDEIGIQRAALQAQADAARAQVGVQTAQYQAQAAQFKIDQEVNRVGSMVNLSGGDINRLGQYNAMSGAGAGLAQGGGNTGLAGMGAQIAVGAALGSNLAAGAAGAMGGAAPRAPGAPGAPGVGMGVALLACPQCTAQVPAGKFCAECGATMGPPKRHCANCSVELLPNARFCPECGTPTAAQAGQAAPPAPPAGP